MQRINEVIVVEGRYDKNTLKQVVEADILETSGFGIFKDKQKQKLLRRIAEQRGLVVLTDSDGAGFVIRNFIRSCVPQEYLKHAYIPDQYGKERRKSSPSKEGKLGVEGMRPEVLLEALRRSGVRLLEAGEKDHTRAKITKADFYALGLSGKNDSTARRAALLKSLDLPERLTADGLLEILNGLMSREDFLRLCQTDPPDRPER